MKMDIKKVKIYIGIILSLALLLAGCGTTSTTNDADTKHKNTTEASETVTDKTATTEDSASNDNTTSNITNTENSDTEIADNESMQQSSTVIEGPLTVTFLDVGQGNAVLVENDGLYMLVDGGDREYSSFVVSYLQRQGIESLEYVISSHYDADHLNGIVGALNVFPCELLLDADYETDTKVYQSLLSVIDEKDIPEVHPDMGDTYSFGDATFTIVCPDAYDYSDDNDNSIGIRLVHGDNSFLICGDASSEVEKVMMMSGLDISADVYLASHHGSAYSSSADFLKKVNPKAVVISAGMGNSYGHPTTDVMNNIQNIGAELYRTDLQGTLTVTSDGTNLTWNVATCLDYRSGEEIESGEKTESGEKSESTNQSLESGTVVNDSSTTSETGLNYILNLNTKKFHEPSCSSVNSMNEENKANFTGTRQELIDAGYDPCGRCKP